MMPELPICSVAHRRAVGQALPMLTAESEPAFQSFLGSQYGDLAELDVRSAIEAWIEFYKAQRVDDVADGMDWLWFQFGTYDWGQGPSFQIDLTRQFILQDETDDDAIWQMHLVLPFRPIRHWGRASRRARSRAMPTTS
jgi:hypothetical protein